ncbi:MAG TPA: hypothetical protein VFI25_05415 [Planctomycetota bacterium]|nr:hypothetical protein [Planctomycetota bacterium]
MPENRVAAVEKFLSRETTRRYGHRLVPFFANTVSCQETGRPFAAALGMPKGRRLVEDGFTGYLPATVRRRRRARAG